MIDFHSHILPGIDDGSPDVETSLRMVKALSEQGVDTICATSHFYADQRTPDRFVYRRQQAWDKLRVALPDESPQIRLGAEVLYFPGISGIEALPQLLLEGTDLLLLEMPFTQWSEYMIQEVNDLARNGRCTILMAHIERYFGRYSRKVWDSFLDNGILMQSNADYFLTRWGKHKAIKLLAQGRLHLLGTDTHNMNSRAPHMDQALAFISKELGEECLAQIDALGREILEGADP